MPNYGGLGTYHEFCSHFGVPCTFYGSENANIITALRGSEFWHGQYGLLQVTLVQVIQTNNRSITYRWT